MLTDAGILTDGSAILTLETGTEGVTVDMNQAFLTQLSSMGTTGEYMLMGSIVNTVLAATGTDSLTQTVEGETAETGHTIYDGALKFYEDNTAV